MLNVGSYILAWHTSAAVEGQVQHIVDIRDSLRADVMALFYAVAASPQTVWAQLRMELPNERGLPSGHYTVTAESKRAI